MCDKNDYNCEDLGLTNGESTALYLLLLKSTSLDDKHSIHLMGKGTAQVKKRKISIVLKATIAFAINDGQMQAENMEVIKYLESIADAIIHKSCIEFDYYHSDY